MGSCSSIAVDRQARKIRNISRDDHPTTLPILFTPPLLPMQVNKVSDNWTTKVVLNNRGIWSRLISSLPGQRATGSNIKVVNETEMTAIIIAVPSMWQNAFLRNLNSYHMALDAKTIEVYRTVEIRREKATALQLPPNEAINLTQWNGGNNDMIVIVATLEGSELSVWTKLVLQFGATATLYPGLFHPDMFPLFGRHVHTPNETIVQTILSVVLPQRCVDLRLNEIPTLSPTCSGLQQSRNKLAFVTKTMILSQFPLYVHGLQIDYAPQSFGRAQAPLIFP